MMSEDRANTALITLSTIVGVIVIGFFSLLLLWQVMEGSIAAKIVSIVIFVLAAIAMLIKERRRIFG